VLVQACSDSARSPEDEIRQFIEAGVEAGENRSADDLSELIHPDYSDQNGYNRKQLGKLLRVYFFRHKSIHLFTRIDEIELLTDNEASVRLHVAMAGTVISDVNALSISPGWRALACSLNPQWIFFSRKYARLFRSFRKSIVNPKPCAMMCKDARMRCRQEPRTAIPPPGEICGLSNPGCPGQLPYRGNR